MRGRLFNLLAALSLLAGIAVAGVWVRSYWKRGTLDWTGRYLERWQRSVKIGCDSGTTFVLVSDVLGSRDQGEQEWTRTASHPVGGPGFPWGPRDRFGLPSAHLGLHLDARAVSVLRIGQNENLTARKPMLVDAQLTAISKPVPLASPINGRTHK